MFFRTVGPVVIGVVSGAAAGHQGVADFLGEYDADVILCRPLESEDLEVQPDSSTQAWLFHGRKTSGIPCRVRDGLQGLDLSDVTHLAILRVSDPSFHGIKTVTILTVDPATVAEMLK